MGQWVNIDLAGYLFSQRCPVEVAEPHPEGCGVALPPPRKLVVLKPTFQALTPTPMSAGAQMVGLCLQHGPPSTPL